MGSISHGWHCSAEGMGGTARLAQLCFLRAKGEKDKGTPLSEADSCIWRACSWVTLIWLRS